MDARAQNAVLWNYPERIRQIDALCDEARLRGEPFVVWQDSTGQGWRRPSHFVGFAIVRLQRARLAETGDPYPDGLGPAVIFEYAALIGPLDRWLRERSVAA